MERKTESGYALAKGVRVFYVFDQIGSWAILVQAHFFQKLVDSALFFFFFMLGGGLALSKLINIHYPFFFAFTTDTLA